jgi:hypothetical protein
MLLLLGAQACPCSLQNMNPDDVESHFEGQQQKEQQTELKELDTVKGAPPLHWLRCSERLTAALIKSLKALTNQADAG